MPFEDYTTVEEVLDGDVILVGEQHHEPGAPRSEELAWEVIAEYDPGTVAIEAHRPRTRRSGAMGALCDYSREADIPLVAIDNDNQWDQLDCDRGELMERANHFTYPIEENGDLDARAIYDARERIRDEFGEEAHEMMYDNREDMMATRLRGIYESGENELIYSFDLPVVVGIGVFHIRAIRDRLEDGDGVGVSFPTESRAQNVGEQVVQP